MVLYVVNEKTPILNSRSREIMHKQGERMKMHCFNVSLYLLQKQKDVGDIFNAPTEQQS